VAGLDVLFDALRLLGEPVEIEREVQMRLLPTLGRQLPTIEDGVEDGFERVRAPLVLVPELTGGVGPGRGGQRGVELLRHLRGEPAGHVGHAVEPERQRQPTRLVLGLVAWLGITVEALGELLQPRPEVFDGQDPRFGGDRSVDLGPQLVGELPEMDLDLWGVSDALCKGGRSEPGAVVPGGSARC
jgi:hypothetical protein